MKNETPELLRMSRPLDEVDPEVAEALRDEVRRQATGLELIASENFVSEAVLEAMGSVFTNKYAEGYPGKRYYGGCEYVDIAEQLAIDRAKELFGAEHAKVQPHSGAQANAATYFALMDPGDTLMGLELAHGGHPGSLVGDGLDGSQRILEAVPLVGAVGRFGPIDQVLAVAGGRDVGGVADVGGDLGRQ